MNFSDLRRFLPAKPVLAIFLAALTLRLLYLAEITDLPYFSTLVLDAFEYDRLAAGLLQGNWLIDRQGGYVHSLLYPYMLGLLKFFGANNLLVRVMQMLLGAFSCVLIYRIAAHLFPPPAPLLAGLFAACYWTLIFYNGELLATTLVVLIQLLLVDLLLRSAGKVSNKTAALAGLLSGLLVLTRGNTLLLLPVALWAVWRLSGAPARRLVHVGFFALCLNA